MSSSSSSSSITIKVTNDINSNPLPRLVSFPNGIPSNVTDLSIAINEKGSSKGSSSSNKDSSKRKRIVVAHDNDIEYQGISNIHLQFVYYTTTITNITTTDIITTTILLLLSLS